MQRLALSTLLTSLTVATASAAPLNLDPSAQSAPAAPSGIGTIFTAAPPVSPSPRYASADGSNLGGGFIEMLFGGPGRAQPAAPRYQPAPDYQPAPSYQPAPNMVSQSDPTAPAAYQQPRYRAFEPDAGYEPVVAVEPSRRAVDPRYLRQEVSYDGKERPGTVIINTKERLLYLVKESGKATRYGIGVGRQGFTWAGTHNITSKREWPDWRPPPEMLKRQPHLPRYMPGGPDNPLGARAMYLGSTLYRIHGSNEPWTIGQAVSSGCIRMRNDDVIHLYNQVKVGTRVVVI
jgi:lipoprotein-anchoring transpeptidase ErfK/SrfK